MQCVWPNKVKIKAFKASFSSGFSNQLQNLRVSISWNSPKTFHLLGAMVWLVVPFLKFLVVTLYCRLQFKCFVEINVCLRKWILLARVSQTEVSKIPILVIPTAKCINPFHTICLFLYPLKTSENQRFFDVFRGYRKRPVAWNGLTHSQSRRFYQIANTVIEMVIWW